MQKNIMTTLKVMSFNLLSKDKAAAPVAGGEPADMRVNARSSKVNALLLGEGIDIAGLQEASLPWQNWLCEGLDPHYAWLGTCTANTQEGGYIIYRKDLADVVESGTFWLAPGAPLSPQKGWDTTYDRLCTWALFRIRETQSLLLFLNTHLDHKGQTAKAEGAKLILEQLHVLRHKVAEAYGTAACPVILTGDMNATPREPAYGIFTAQLGDALLLAEQTDADPSHDSSPNLYFQTDRADICKRSHRIDYIFFTEDSVNVKAYEMIHTTTNLSKYGPYISDHNAVIALVQF